jgi:hypothetical protein
MYPQMDSGGLTSGVNYFGSVGRGRNAALNLNRGPQTIASAETEVPQGTGFVPAPTETGFTSGSGGGDSSGGMGDTGGQNAPFSADQARTASFVGQGAQLLGAATGSRELGMAGNFLGAGAAASQGNFVPLGQTVLGMAGQSDAARGLGLLATGLGAINAYNDDPVNNERTSKQLGSMTVNTLANQIPGVGALNFGLRAGTYFANPDFPNDASISIGDIAAFGPEGYERFGRGPIDSAQGGKAIMMSPDPQSVRSALEGMPTANDPRSFDRAAVARGLATDTTYAPGMTVNAQGQLVSTEDMTNQQNMAYFGVSPNTTVGEGIASPSIQSFALDGGDVMGPGAPGSVGRDAFEASGGGFGDPSAGMGGAFEGSAGSTAGTADSPDGPDGANAGSGGFGGMSNQGEGGFGSMGGWKDGGMIGDMPGITQRYMDGGPVQGGPMLAMGYAEGGMMGRMGGKPTPAIVNRQVDAMLRDPRARQTLLARPQQLMASGELTPDEVTTMGRVAEAALFSPELYPQLRQFVAAQGMTPLPAAFDPSVIMRIMAITRGLQQATPAGQVPGTDQAQMQRPVPGEGNGGYLQGPGTGRSDSIGTVNETTGEPVKVANGEYVIPSHIVRAKGREFFDNLLRRYSDVPKGE